MDRTCEGLLAVETAGGNRMRFLETWVNDHCSFAKLMSSSSS